MIFIQKYVSFITETVKDDELWFIWHLTLRRQLKIYFSYNFNCGTMHVFLTCFFTKINIAHTMWAQIEYTIELLGQLDNMIIFFV